MKGGETPGYEFGARRTPFGAVLSRRADTSFSPPKREPKGNRQHRCIVGQNQPCKDYIYARTPVSPRKAGMQKFRIIKNHVQEQPKHESSTDKTEASQPASRCERPKRSASRNCTHDSVAEPNRNADGYA